MKYIFPRQFGLQSVFADRGENTNQLNPYASREKEISELEMYRKQTHARPDKSGDASEKLPKRLRGQAVDLVQKLRVRHARCSYGELLNYYCPSEVSFLRQISHIPADFAVEWSLEIWTPNISRKKAAWWSWTWIVNGRDFGYTAPGYDTNQISRHISAPQLNIERGRGTGQISDRSRGRPDTRTREKAQA